MKCYSVLGNEKTPLKNCENLLVDKRTKPTVANIAETVSSTSSFSLNEYYEQRSLLHPPPRSNVQAAKTWFGEREARACDTEKNTPNYIENIIILCRFIKLFCRYISHMLSRTKERRTIEAVRRGWDWVDCISASESGSSREISAVTSITILIPV